MTTIKFAGHFFKFEAADDSTDNVWLSVSEDSDVSFDEPFIEVHCDDNDGFDKEGFKEFIKELKTAHYRARLDHN